MAAVRRKWTPEEDRTLKQLAGVKPAAEIATIIGRPKGGVHHRIKMLGLDGSLVGENHWNAKIDNLKAAMIGCLYDGGFTVNEIARVVNENVSTVNDIAAGRTR